MKSKKIHPETLSLATRAIHGRKLYPFRGTASTPIYQTANYRFGNSRDAIRYADSVNNDRRRGVDVVVESATKYLGGQSDLVAGSVVGRAGFIDRVK